MKLIEWFRSDDEVITMKASTFMWGVATVVFSTIAGVYLAIYLYPTVNLPIDILDIILSTIITAWCFFMMWYSKKE